MRRWEKGQKPATYGKETFCQSSQMGTLQKWSCLKYVKLIHYPGFLSALQSKYCILRNSIQQKITVQENEVACTKCFNKERE